MSSFLFFCLQTIISHSTSRDDAIFVLLDLRMFSFQGYERLSDGARPKNLSIPRFSLIVASRPSSRGKTGNYMTPLFISIKA